MSKHWFSKGKWKYRFVNIIEPVSVWIFAFCSFFPQLVNLSKKMGPKWKIVIEWMEVPITILWILTATVIFGFQLYFFAKQKKWAVVNLQNKLYSAAMRAQEKSNEAKMKSVLQITYGNVPEWNPRNYESNVLLYDGHEHIRRILLDMRDALREVLSTADQQVDADAVSVDLVYCYPGKECDGLLPVNFEETIDEVSSDMEENNNIGSWRVITSGNSSVMASRESKQANIRKF